MQSRFSLCWHKLRWLHCCKMIPCRNLDLSAECTNCVALKATWWSWPHLLVNLWPCEWWRILLLLCSTSLLCMVLLAVLAFSNLRTLLFLCDNCINAHVKNIAINMKSVDDTDKEGLKAGASRSESLELTKLMAMAETSDTQCRDFAGGPQPGQADGCKDH